MDESNHYLKKIDKPMLRITQKIQSDDLNTDLGQPLILHDTSELKKKIGYLGEEVKSQYAMFRGVGVFLVIVFSLAIVVACICTVKPGTNIASILSALVFMESFVWIPTIFIIERNNAFQVALNGGEIQGYLFQIQDKWVHEYYDDYDTKKMYLIQFANAYAEAGYAYHRLKKGDRIAVYIVSYKGNQYFGGWFVNSSQDT